MTQRYRENLTVQELRHALDYDPETGVFRWKHRTDRAKNWNTRHSGQMAGHVQKFHHDKMYVTIRLNGALYLAHRLAWLFMKGEWPERDLDHEDTDSLNNRIGNLRLATMSENLCNQRKHRDNKSGHKGISRHGAKWRVCIGFRKERVVASFSSLDAAIAYHAKMTKILHGEFART